MTTQIYSSGQLSTIAQSILGSTEGTFYNGKSGLIDTHYYPAESTGVSGLSFGLMQNDVAHNPPAAALFQQMLDNGVASHLDGTQLVVAEHFATERG